MKAEAGGQFEAAGDRIAATKQGSVTVDLDLVGGQFVYTLTDTTGTDLVRNTSADGYYLRIEEMTDTTIELYLAADKDWAFDSPALTLKKATDAKFYKVDADPADPRHVTVHATSTKLKPQPSGKPGEIQRYNLHVVMAQPGGSTIEVRIDPDLKNPPPAGG